METLLRGIPADLPAAVAVVIHRGKGDDAMLAGLLRQACAMPLGDAEDKEPIRAGRVYLAPAEYHLLVEGDHFALSTERPINHARPSIDALFESAAFGIRNAKVGTRSDFDLVIGVVLSGANDDGARGLALIAARGGEAIVQDTKTAEAAAMPEAAIKAVADAHVMPVEEIGPFLARAISSRMAAAAVRPPSA